MKKIHLLGLLLVLLGMVIAGCSSTPAAPPPAPTPQEKVAEPVPEQKGDIKDALAASQNNEAVTLRYAHPNGPTTVPGIFADTFAKLVQEKTGGKVTIKVFPSSQLGSLQEMVEEVQDGTIAFHHNTMAAVGAIYPDFAAFDTPYLYRDIDHLLKVTRIDSPVMQKFNQGLVDARGVRLINTFYFGTRHLTADREIKSPADLKGIKIRSIPFPIYTAAIEGMGAIATPIDWAEVPAALSAGIVNGQENPVDTIYSSKFYQIQSHLMLTGHIKAADAVVVNEKIWQSLAPETQAQILAAAHEAGEKATQMAQDLEAEYIQKLEDAGMTVIGPAEGLDLEAFEKQVTALIDERFSDKYNELYREIKAIK